MEMDGFLARRRLPMIMQAESAECSLACVAMVAGRHGLRCDLHTLRAHCPVSSAGATVDSLMNAARSLRLSPRPLKLEVAELGRLQLPAVLHWDLDHFVVLAKVSRRHVIVHDPAIGRRKYALSEIGMHFTGIAVELFPARDFRTDSRRQVNRISDFFTISRGFLYSLAQVFVLSLLLQLIALLTPFYVQLTIDQSLAQRDADLALIIALAFLMIAIARTVLTWLRGMVLIHFSNHVGFQMVSNVFQHLIRLPVTFFERRHIGDIVSRFDSVDSIRQMITEDVISVVVDGLFSVTTLILLYLYSPRLATLVLAFLLAFLVIRLMMMPVERLRRQELIAAEASQRSVLMENMRSIMVTRLYSMENHRTSRWQSSYAETINCGVRLSRLQITATSLQTLLFGVDHVATIYFGTRMVYGAELSIGQLMAFIFLKQHFTTSVTALIPRLVELRLLRLQLERLADITMTETEFSQEEAPLLRTPLRGELEVRGLVYRYPGQEQPVVDELDLRVRAGECIAITGPSGCGKSTALKLLTGLMQPEQGTMYVDGLPLDRFGARDYREGIAAILHNDALLAGSLAYNIALDGEPVDQARLKRVCELAEIHEEIRALPMAFNTLVGDMGTALSAGQVQRVLIARALYRRPAILFLDEAVSNLSTDMAGRIIHRLKKSGMTLVLVTHHPSLISLADRRIAIPESGRQMVPA